MANVVVHAANAHTVVSTGWTNPTNAFSTVTDGVFATAAPARNATTSGDFAFPDFSSADIPDGALINSVTITVNWGMTASVAGGTLGAQLFVGGASQGSETTQTAVTQQNATQVVLGTVTLAHLRSASSTIKARVRCSKGNTNTAMTGNLDFVSLTVNWSPPPPTKKQVGAFGKAKAVASKLNRSKGGVIAIGLAMLPIHGVINQPIPFGMTATGTIGVAAHAPPPKVTVVKKPLPRGHRGGLISMGLAIPAPTAPGTANGVINKPLPFGFSAQGQADYLAFAAGIQVYPKPYVKPHRGRISVRRAPQQVGINGLINLPLPFGRTITGSVTTNGVINKPLPFGISAQGSVKVDGVINKAIPFASLITGSVQVDGVINQPIPFGIVASGTVVAGVTGVINQPILFGHTITGSVQASGTINQPIPFGRLITASVRVDGVLNGAVVFGVNIHGVNQAPIIGVPRPTAVDVLSYLPSTADVLSLGTTVDLINYLSRTVDILSYPTTVNILSSESPEMPNLVQPIKQGDTSPALLAVLATLNPDGTVSPNDLTACTVVFNMKLGSKMIVTGGACTIVDAVNGKVQYQWGALDTFKAGSAVGEFKSTDNTGKVKRYPDGTNIIINITAQVGP